MTDTVHLMATARVAAQAGRLRRAAAKDSLGFFARTYLPERFNLPFCYMHRHLMTCCEWMMLERGQRVVFAMPPGHGKTSIGVIAHALWAAACHEEKSIIIVRPTPEEARRTLAEVGAALEGAERLQRDFPGAAPRPPSAWAWTASGARGKRSVGDLVSSESDDPWIRFGDRPAEPNTAGMHALLHGRGDEAIVPQREHDLWEARADPLGLSAGPPIALRNGSRIAAIGAGQSMMGQRAVGHRPTLVIIDDAEWELATASGRRIMPPRHEYAPWLDTWLRRLAPAANVLLVGSVVGAQSVMADLLDVRLGAPWAGIGYGVANVRPGDPALWDQCLEIARTGGRRDGFREARRFYEERREALDPERAQWPERWDAFDLCMIEEGLVTRDISRAVFESRWSCFPSTSRPDSRPGWKPCDQADLMVCIWMAENEALAARMDTFDPALPIARPRLWAAERAKRGNGWRVMDLYEWRRELRTELRGQYLDKLARTARLGSNFESACTAFAAGMRPWRGESRNGDSSWQSEWTDGD